MKNQRTPRYYFVVVVLIALSMVSASASAQPVSPSIHSSAPQSPSPVSPNTINCGFPERNFTDVSPGDYFYDAVYFMGCINTYITGFAPDQCARVHVAWPCFLPGTLVTRAQFVVIIGKTYNWLPSGTPTPTPVPGCSFTDVPPNYYALSYITAACNRGVVTGYADHTFHPNDTVLRAEVAAFLVRAVQSNGQAFPYFTPSAPSFTDVPEINWAYGYIETLDENNITIQNGGSWSPNAPTDRATTAVFVDRTVEPPITGAVVPYKRGSFWGISADRTVPYGNNSTHFARGPVELSAQVNPDTDASIIVGPSANFHYQGFGDNGYHPYGSWRASGAPRANAFVDTGVSLAPDSNHYYSFDAYYNYTFNTWYGEFCDTTCRPEVNSTDLLVSVLYYLSAAAETSNVAAPLGITSVNQAKYIPQYGQNQIDWCYTGALSNLQPGTYSLTGCTGYFWSIHWFLP